MKKIYNEENSKLINDLNNLPKINAPDNFEFNLLTRIENKNFDYQNSTTTKFSYIKFLAPSAAAVTVILLFFIFYPQNEELQKQIISQTQNVEGHSIASNTESAADQLVKGDRNRSLPTSRNNSKGNNLTESQRQNLFNSNQSVAVDDYISGNKQNNSAMQRGNIIHNGEQQLPGEMYIEKPLDKKTIERIRVLNDSLKMVQQKADSIKKARK